jgi:hypothetical protein
MEFLGRPNTPNALAQSLVQLAAHANDPYADAIKSIGSVIEEVSAHKAKNSNDKANQTAQFSHEKELKQMDIDARHKDRGHDLLMKLIESGQATPAENKPMTSADAARLIDPNFSGPLQSSNQRKPPAAGSFASENYPGEKLPAGYDINPKDEKKAAPMLALNKDMKVKAPSLAALPDGSPISNKDYIDAVELEKTKKGASADKDMDLAKNIVEKSKGAAELDADQFTKATIAVEAKIKAHRRGEKVTFDEPAPEPEQKSRWERIKESFNAAMSSITPDAKPVKVTAAGSGSSLPGLKITKKKA